MAGKISYYILTLGAFCILSVFSSYTNSSEEKKDNSEESRPVHTLPQIIQSIPIEGDFNFANEKIPIENFDVRERLDRELLVNSYWHSSTVQNIKLANRYFPVIEKILAEQGVPDDFKYLAVAESGLRNATSSAGAKGFWQFLKSTGKEYNMIIDHEIDERYHLEKATVAACKYLKKQHNKFGSWTLAAASYNAGARRINEEMTQQKGHNYFDLNLNQETSRYLFRILAMKEILGDPEKYGFQIPTDQRYAPLDNYINVSVTESNVQWAEFAERNGISYRILKVYNPWLVSSKVTNNSHREYIVKVPRK